MALEDDLKDLEEKYGITFSPDKGRGLYHRSIVNIVPIAGTRSGNHCVLECGHIVQTFGDIRHSGGMVLCQQCKADNT